MIVIKSFTKGISKSGVGLMTLEIEVTFPVMKDGGFVDVTMSSYLIITPTQVDYEFPDEDPFRP